MHHAEQLHGQLLQRSNAEPDAVFGDLEGIRWRAGNQPDADSNSDSDSDSDSNSDSNPNPDSDSGRG